MKLEKQFPRPGNSFELPEYFENILNTNCMAIV